MGYVNFLPNFSKIFTIGDCNLKLVLLDLLLVLFFNPVCFYSYVPCKEKLSLLWQTDPRKG